MESKALVKSTNINVACRFFARTPSRILRMVILNKIIDANNLQNFIQDKTFQNVYLIRK